MHLAMGVPPTRRAVDPALCRLGLALVRADGAFSVSRAVRSLYGNDFVINHLETNDLVTGVSYGRQRRIPRRCGQMTAQEARRMWLLTVRSNSALRIKAASLWPSCCSLAC